ncbi:hypothetical protein B0H14DRAFT_2636082 [Mycena olivaceomarginata]|nr:hypothetical protein B0H14DRAFT_2636082 [Mycena olivaceomarginata]
MARHPTLYFSDGSLALKCIERVFSGMLSLLIPNHPTISLGENAWAWLEKAKIAGVDGTSDATAVEFPALFTAFECEKFLEFVFHTQGWTLQMPPLEDLCAILKTSDFFVVPTGMAYARKGNGEEKITKQEEKSKPTHLTHRALMTRLPMAIEEEVMWRREPCTDENQYSNGNERKEGRRGFEHERWKMTNVRGAIGRRIVNFAHSVRDPRRTSLWSRHCDLKKKKALLSPTHPPAHFIPTDIHARVAQQHPRLTAPAGAVPEGDQEGARCAADAAQSRLCVQPDGRWGQAGSVGGREGKDDDDIFVAEPAEVDGELLWVEEEESEQARHLFPPESTIQTRDDSAGEFTPPSPNSAQDAPIPVKEAAPATPIVDSRPQDKVCTARGIGPAVEPGRSDTARAAVAPPWATIHIAHYSTSVGDLGKWRGKRVETGLGLSQQLDGDCTATRHNLISDVQPVYDAESTKNYSSQNFRAIQHDLSQLDGNFGRGARLWEHAKIIYYWIKNSQKEKFLARTFGTVISCKPIGEWQGKTTGNRDDLLRLFKSIGYVEQSRYGAQSRRADGCRRSESDDGEKDVRHQTWASNFVPKKIRANLEEDNVRRDRPSARILAPNLDAIVLSGFPIAWFSTTRRF